MISYIIGNITETGEGFAVLENNGIGYYLSMPGSSLSRLGGASEIKVYTHMAVREDDVSLFGFLTKGELEMFRMLITVSGIGPKGALGILSSLSVDELKMAIVSEDSKLIAGAKGIGAKTAQKIVVELKGKIDKEFLSAGLSGTAGSAALAPASGSANISQAIDVLEALGFSRTAAVRAIGLCETDENTDPSAIVTMALKVIE